MQKVPDVQLEQIENIVIKALQISFEIHDLLGKSGEEVIEKNQFGDTALKVDIEIENAIIDFLKTTNLNLQIISEEHGTINVGSKADYLVIMDGLDGSGVYKKARNKGRYATMFGIFDGSNPKYQDYLVCGIAEHRSKKIYLATRDKGARIIEKNVSKSIYSSKEKTISAETQIRVDDFFPLNTKVFSEPLKKHGYEHEYNGSSAIYYADVSSGQADLALECTRKNNLEIAIAYGLIHEAGGIMVNINGEDLGPKLYREFGQKEHLSVITSATAALAHDLIKLILKK